MDTPSYKHGQEFGLTGGSIERTIAGTQCVRPFYSEDTNPLDAPSCLAAGSTMGVKVVGSDVYVFSTFTYRV